MATIEKTETEQHTNKQKTAYRNTQKLVELATKYLADQGKKPQYNSTTIKRLNRICNALYDEHQSVNQYWEHVKSRLDDNRNLSVIADWDLAKQYIHDRSHMVTVSAYITAVDRLKLNMQAQYAGINLSTYIAELIKKDVA